MVLLKYSIFSNKKEKEALVLYNEKENNLDKPVLVFVPGMFCHAGVFKKLITFFTEQKYICRSLTMPFHHRLFAQNPPVKLADFGIQEYVEYLETELAKIKQDYILIGHSMGGLISMKTAALETIHPKALILLAPASPYGVLALRYTVIKSFWDILTTPNFWKMSINLNYKSFCYSMANQLPEEERSRIYNSLRWESGRAAFQIGFWFIDSSRATEVVAKNITCPIAVFSGLKDRITPYNVVKATAKFLDVKPNLMVRAAEWLWNLRKGQWKKNDFRRVNFIPLENHGHWLLTEMDPQLILNQIEIVLNPDSLNSP